MFNIAKDSSSTHSCIDKAQHARKRRVLAQGLSTSAVKAMEDRMTVHLRTFCNQLHTTTPDSANYPDQKVTYRQWGPPQNMAEWCSYLGYDAMGEMAFGKSFDMLRSVRNRFVIDLMADSDRVNFTASSFQQILHLIKCSD